MAVEAAVAVACPEPPVIAPRPIFKLTDRQLQFFELVLVCTIAFSSGLFSSFYYLFSGLHYSSGGARVWIFSAFRQLSVLVLLWYVLLRRSKSFFDIGLSWRRSDIPWSLLLRIGGSAAGIGVYNAIYFSQLTAINRSTAGFMIRGYVFGGGVTFATILAMFVNPFYEELIVRAYLMTEVKALTNSTMLAIVSSTVLQMSYHFYQGVPAALAHGGTFLIFSIYYAKTSRIAPVILAHLYSDLGAALFYLLYQYHGS